MGICTTFSRSYRAVVTVLLVAIVASFLSGCSNLKQLATVGSVNLQSHPLKTKKDLRTEALLTTGTWKYQRQKDDCNDTTWSQRFYKNRYYQSGGSACLLADAFSVDAESWYIKNGLLYITNLSPVDENDIILKYGIDYIDGNKLILSSKGYQYTFLK